MTLLIALAKLFLIGSPDFLIDDKSLAVLLMHSSPSQSLISSP